MSGSRVGGPHGALRATHMWPTWGPDGIVGWDGLCPMFSSSLVINRSIVVLFPGLPSEVSSSPVVVVSKKALDLTRAGPGIAQSTLLPSRVCSTEGIDLYSRGRLSDGHIAMKLNKTHLI